MYLQIKEVYLESINIRVFLYQQKFKQYQIN